jgi:predicted nucleotidyltransferase
MKLEGVLRKITGLIVRACDPETIVLFGSYAKGQQNADSDLDILVIGDFGHSFLQCQELKGLLHYCMVPIDIHIVTPEEAATGLRKPYGFLDSVLKSGVILYSRSKGYHTTIIT